MPIQMLMPLPLLMPPPLRTPPRTPPRLLDLNQRLLESRLPQLLLRRPLKPRSLVPSLHRVLSLSGPRRTRKEPRPLRLHLELFLAHLYPLPGRLQPILLLLNPKRDHLLLLGLRKARPQRLPRPRRRWRRHKQAQLRLVLRRCLLLP